MIKLVSMWRHPEELPVQTFTLNVTLVARKVRVYFSGRDAIAVDLP